MSDALKAATDTALHDYSEGGLFGRIKRARELLDVLMDAMPPEVDAKLVERAAVIVQCTLEDAESQIRSDDAFFCQPLLPVVFHWKDKPIRTMADVIAMEGTWENFCDKVASMLGAPTPIRDADLLFNQVLSLVPVTLQDQYRTDIMCRITRAGERARS